MKKKSILIKEFHHKELVKISRAFGLQYGNLVESMISYFKKTGINPNEAINENPSAQIKALDKRIVSFLKVQERDILKPIRNEVYQYSLDQIKEISKLNSWVKKAIVQLDKNNSNRHDKISNLLVKQESKLQKQEQAILLIAKFLDENNKTGIQGKLKSIFK